MRVKRPTSKDCSYAVTRFSATCLSTTSGRFNSMAGAPVAASRTRVRSCSPTGVHRTSRFEDYSRCAGPWAERSDGMTSAMIRPANRTSIALPKPIARGLRLLRGLARARFECSTSWARKPSARFACNRACLLGARARAKPRGIHALHGNLCQASESSHHALHGPDRSVSPSRCLSGPRQTRSAALVTHVCVGAARCCA